MPGDQDQLINLLEEIRDNRKLQPDRQAGAPAMQKEQFALSRQQVEQTLKIQDRAGKPQDQSTRIIGGSSKAFFVVVPGHHLSCYLPVLAAVPVTDYRSFPP